jgi:hypothetical protein
MKPPINAETETFDTTGGWGGWLEVGVGGVVIIANNADNAHICISCGVPLMSERSMVQGTTLGPAFPPTGELR